MAEIHKERAEFSARRLEELTEKVEVVYKTAELPDLVIFTAGSYGGLEASAHSDIDLFFLYPGDRDASTMPHTRELRLYGHLLQIADEMAFPAFSNDGEYLDARTCKDVLGFLGSAKDDGKNLFTLRMLLLLESKCIHNSQGYEAVMAEIVRSYYRDYPDHQATFQPWFLLNDIARFWKTLLLNYENKRNTDTVDEVQKTKQKVRNFKLKFSRMTTCFATIAALGARQAPVEADDVLALVQLTPRERLLDVADRFPKSEPLVEEVLHQYDWFLEMTGLPEPDLRGHFDDKTKRTEMFGKANQYGDAMFGLVSALDSSNGGPVPQFLRFLII